MRTSAIIRIIVYSLLIVILLGILLSATAANLSFTNAIVRNDALTPTESTREINQHNISTQVQNIEIDWVAGSITIHPSDSLSNIVIEEYCSAGSDYEMVCRQSGQTLKIEFTEDHDRLHLFGNNDSVSKDLIIRVPQNWNCNNLEIDAASSAVNIQDLTIDELDFDGASGNLILDNCNIVSLEIDTASGDVEFSGILKELDFNAASAKFHGKFYQVPNHLNLDAMSGNVELVLPSYSGFYLELDTMSGSFDSDFDLNAKGAHYECGDGACKIKVSAMSGNVSILKGIDVPATAGTNCDH